MADKASSGRGMTPVKLDMPTPEYKHGKTPFSKWDGKPGPLPANLGKNNAKGSKYRQPWFEEQLFEMARKTNDHRVPWAFEFSDDNRFQLDKGCVGFAIANGVVRPPPNGVPIQFLELNPRDRRFPNQPQSDLHTRASEIVAGVTAADVRRAAVFIDNHSPTVVKEFAGTSQWAKHDFLLVDGQRYPLKIIGAIAHRMATGKDLGTGFTNTITFTQALNSLGFQKAEDGADEPELQEVRQQIEEEEQGYLALTAGDARRRTLRSIALRQGARAFRDALLKAYGGRCAVTSCDVPAALEAAHIVPYMGSHTDVVTNGMLLRADIHTLFDLSLLAVDPDSLQLRVSATIRHHDFAYGLSGLRLRLPADPNDAPNCDALRMRLKQLR